MRSSQRGFTLIELVMVIVLIGILAATAIPRFVDQSDMALAATKRGMSGAVKSALSIYVADQRTYPTLAQLASYVQGEGVQAQPDGAGGGGVIVLIDATQYVVPTYTDPNCTTATNSTANVVQCVGSIPHP